MLAEFASIPKNWLALKVATTTFQILHREGFRPWNPPNLNCHFYYIAYGQGNPAFWKIGCQVFVKTGLLTDDNISNRKREGIQYFEQKISQQVEQQKADREHKSIIEEIEAELRLEVKDKLKRRMAEVKEDEQWIQQS